MHLPNTSFFAILWPLVRLGGLLKNTLMKNPLRPLFDYLSASKAELEKVTWPTQKDVIRYTVMVVVVSVAMATFFSVLDLGLTKGRDLILKQRPASSTPTTQTTEIPAENLESQLKVDDVQVTTSTPSN